MRRLLSSAAFHAPRRRRGRAGRQRSEGALFLLLPTGAQPSVWDRRWSPRSPAGDECGGTPLPWRPGEARLAIHHSKTVAGVGDALTFVTPVRSYGTVALAINILNIANSR